MSISHRLAVIATQIFFSYLLSLGPNFDTEFPGIPHGTVLGPLLFVMYINDLPESADSHIYMFADDTKVFKLITSHEDHQDLQSDLDNLMTWTAKPSRVGYGWRQWCLGSLSRKWVPGDRQRWQLYNYPWRLEACKRLYTPQGVEQVTDITGVPGIICKALWASFGKKKHYIRTAYYY